MMADLMNEHMGDDGAQGLLMLGPVIENGTPVEEDHIGKCAGMREFLGLGEAGSLEQPEEIELALGLQVVEHIVFGEILHPDDDVAGKVVEGRGQTRIGLGGQRVKFLERRRFEAA